MDTHVKVLGALQVALGAIGLLVALLLSSCSAAPPVLSARAAIRARRWRSRSSGSREPRSSRFCSRRRCRVLSSASDCCGAAPGHGSPASAVPRTHPADGLAFWASKTLLSAVELGLFTKLAESRHGGRLRARSGCIRAPPATSSTRWSRSASCSAPATSLEHAGASLFLDKQKPSYVGGILEMANRRLYGFWNHLTEALRTGEPQNEVKARRAVPFATLYADPARLRQFLPAMTGISHGANMTIAQKFPWQQVQDVRRRRHRAGRSRRPGRAGQPAPEAASASTCRWSSRSSRSTSQTNGVGDRV